MYPQQQWLEIKQLHCDVVRSRATVRALADGAADVAGQRADTDLYGECLPLLCSAAKAVPQQSLYVLHSAGCSPGVTGWKEWGLHHLKGV